MLTVSAAGGHHHDDDHGAEHLPAAAFAGAGVGGLRAQGVPSLLDAQRDRHRPALGQRGQHDDHPSEHPRCGRLVAHDRHERLRQRAFGCLCQGLGGYLAVEDGEVCPHVITGTAGSILTVRSIGRSH